MYDAIPILKAEVWAYFTETENYRLKDGKALEGFMPSWIGEFYAYYQWYYNLPSAELVKKIPVSFLKKGVCWTSRLGA